MATFFGADKIFHQIEMTVVSNSYTFRAQNENIMKTWNVFVKKDHLISKITLISVCIILNIA